MLILREAVPEDMRFVASSWFESYMKSLVLAKELPFEVFRSGMNARIERLCANSRIVVACAKSVPDEILGYVVFDKDAVHWAYVKNYVRRQGIGSALVAGTSAKHYTHKVDKRASFFVKAMRLQFTPALADPDATRVTSSGNRKEGSCP